jgi:hypothetical protein
MQVQVMNEIPKGLTGIAGVFYVALELTRHGFIALPTVRNTAGIDILVVNPHSSKHVCLQVKCSRNRVSFWPLGGPVPVYMKGNDSFYVFVRDNGNEQFEAFVVSGKEVYKFSEKHILEVEKRNKTAWYQWNLPKGREDEYRNNWKKLGLR